MPSGFLQGTLTSFGDYDQCLSTSYKHAQNDVIRGKYFSVNLYPLDLWTSDQETNNDQNCIKSNPLLNSHDQKQTNDDNDKIESTNGELVDLTDLSLKGMGSTQGICLSANCTSNDVLLLMREGNLIYYPKLN